MLRYCWSRCLSQMSGKPAIAGCSLRTRDARAASLLLQSQRRRTRRLPRPASRSCLDQLFLRGPDSAREKNGAKRWDQADLWCSATMILHDVCRGDSGSNRTRLPSDKARFLYGGNYSLIPCAGSMGPLYCVERCRNAQRRKFEYRIVRSGDDHHRSDAPSLSRPRRHSRGLRRKHFGHYHRHRAPISPKSLIGHCPTDSPSAYSATDYRLTDAGPATAKMLRQAAKQRMRPEGRKL
jgi:hypothetical protein